MPRTCTAPVLREKRIDVLLERTALRHRLTQHPCGSPGAMFGARRRLQSARQSIRPEGLIASLGAGGGVVRAPGAQASSHALERVGGLWGPAQRVLQLAGGQLRRAGRVGHLQVEVADRALAQAYAGGGPRVGI